MRVLFGEKRRVARGSDAKEKMQELVDGRGSEKLNGFAEGSSSTVMLCEGDDDIG
jgi:hypothetical protein